MALEDSIEDDMKFLNSMVSKPERVIKSIDEQIEFKKQIIKLIRRNQ